MTNTILSRRLHRAVTLAALLLGCLCWGGSPADAQVYLGDEPPTTPGVYFLGYQDIYGNVEPTAAGLAGPPVQEVYLSIGSSAGDFVALRSTDGAGWSFFDFDLETELWLFGGWDWMDVPLYEVAE